MIRVQIAMMVVSITAVCNTAWPLDLGAVKDNSIFQDVPNNSAGAGLGVFSGNNNNRSPRHGLIQFDVAGSIPAGVTITSVTLTMTLEQSPSTNSFTVDLHRLTADWGEGSKSAGTLSGMGAAAGPNDATWNANLFGSSSWTTPGGDFSPTVSASASIGGSGSVGTAYSWSGPTLLADVISWYANPSSNHGWILINENEGAGDSQTVKAFYSREASPTTVRPVLSVTFVPEPTAAGLMLITLPLGLVHRHRRK